MAQYCQSNQDTFSGFSEQNAVGNVVTSSNSVVGKNATALTGYLRDGGSATGTIYARVYNSSGVLQATFGSIDASTLTGSEATYVFTLSSGSHTVATSDRFVFEADFSTGSAESAVATSAQSGWERIEFKDGSWTTPTVTVAIKMCITATAAPSTSTTLLPPPIAMVNL
jgi:hypothetical protein